MLGVRPEDLQVVAPGAGVMNAPVYAFELTGDSVLVTITVGGQLICARGDRHFRCEIGDTVGIAFDPARTYLFDAETENRIRL